MVTLRRLPRITARRTAVLAAVMVVLAGAWLWFRDSSLVAVKRVTVTGVSGPNAALIRQDLTVAARGMTTLDVSVAALRKAVGAYPAVKSIQVSTEFPHGIAIRVIEEIPVAAMVVGGHSVVVGSDGALLYSAPGATSLPTIPTTVPPGGTRVTGGSLSDVALLAAAPYQLLPHVGQVMTVAHHGLTALLRNGPSIYFGNTEQLAAKWTAAAAVLADSTSAGAVYIDVSDPNRPAAGG